MSSSSGKRNSQSRRTPSSQSGETEDLLLDDVNMNDDEKESKIIKEQKTRFQQFMYLFGLLAVAAFILGTAQQSKQNKNNVDVEMRRFPNNNIRNKEAAESSNNVVVPDSIKMDNEVVDGVEEEEGGGIKATEKPNKRSIHELELAVEVAEESVRERKMQPGMIMESDKVALQLTSELQSATKELIEARYGTSPKRVEITVKFPPTIPDYTPSTEIQSFVIEMAPYDIIPCSVYYFLELCRTYKGGAFHRNAGHVLQASAFSDVVKKPMPFQEYSSEHPHKKYSTGYCGRPSGPGWYVSIIDNTKNHGPGSQQKKNPYEADSNFGNLITGMEDVIPRIHSIPQKEWLDEKHKMKILKMTILVPKYSDDDSSNIVEWIPWSDGDMPVNKP